MIPAPSLFGTRALVLNAASPSKKALPPTIGHLMANSIAFPVVNLNIGSSFQLQLMKKFTNVSVILSLAEFPPLL